MHMKFNYHTFFILLFALIAGCKKEEPEVTILSSSVISFVHEDGSALAADECIKPLGKYAVSVTVKFDDPNSKAPYTFEYTLNGAAYSMTFTKEGTQINKITLVNGFNTAKVSGSNIEAKIFLGSHDEYQLVN